MQVVSICPESHNIVAIWLCFAETSCS